MKMVMLRGAKAAGRHTLVDDGDLGLVSEYLWRVHERRPREGFAEGPYAVADFYRNGLRTTIFMHTLITGWPLVDHKDHDGLNNTRSNLRPATKAQNSFNSRPQSATSSQYKGVTWHRGCRKWQATIKTDGKCRYLGLFVSEDEAALAYNAAARVAFGEYAYLNEVAA